MNLEIYECLKKIARQGKVVTYSDIALVAGKVGADISNLVADLEVIAEFEVEAGRPLLVIVVVKNDTKIPGKGLFAWAAKKGLHTDTDDMRFFANELNRVHKYWRAAGNA